MRCTNCGTENEESYKFCGNCGNPLATPPFAQTYSPMQESSALTDAPLSYETEPTALDAATLQDQQVTPPGLTLEQRREILSNHITKFVMQGYRIVSQTDTTAQLVKPKHFSCFWATVFLLLSILLIGLILIIIYLFAYMAEKDKTVYVEVDNDGQITEIHT